MREVKYLSPTSLRKYETSPKEFYLTYLADNPIRSPQTAAMAAGSAFDAFVKAAFYQDTFGRTDPEYELDFLYEQEVEPHNRDSAREVGRYLFEAYKLSGFYAELLKLLDESDRPPRFERERIKEVNGVPIKGRPDCVFHLKSGAQVVLDWKVNGYYSNYQTSPFKYFKMGRHAHPKDKYKLSGKCHPEYVGTEWHGVEIFAGPFESIYDVWADQLITYSWLLSERCDEVCFCIHQLAAKPSDSQFPFIRVFEYWGRASNEYCEALMVRYQTVWDALKSGRIFLDVSVEEGQALIRAFDELRKTGLLELV